MTDALNTSGVVLVKANTDSNSTMQLTDRGATELRVKAIVQHFIDEAAMVSLQTIIASVTQVIYNEDDLEGKDVSHIGCIKVALPEVGFPQKPANSWIRPLDAQVRSYPIVGEMVNIINYGGKTFYFQPLNFSNSINHNIMAGFEKDGSTPQKVNEDAVFDYLGGFDYQKNPRPVTQYPGDWALNGRNDQSIRLGMDYHTSAARGSKELSANNAVIKMRISHESKPTTEIPDGSTRVEDIDTDKASLYMTRSEDIKFKVTPKVDNITNWSTAGAAAIILDSDRIIFNTKESTTTGQIDIFSGNTVNIISKLNTNIIGEMVKLGDTNNDNLQSAVLGESLVTFLSQLIERLDNLAKDLGSLTGIGNVGGVVVLPAAMAAGNKLGGWTSATTKESIGDLLLSKNIKVSQKVRPEL